MNTSTPWDTERVFWREWIKSQIVSEYDAALVAGTPQKTYHRSLGMPEEYIITGSNVVDNSFFERASVAADNRIVTDPNTDLPGLLSSPRPFIAVSRLISRKNIDTLIRAYATYRSRSPRARDLVIIGDGPIQDSLRDLTNELAVEGVFFAGKRPIDEVAKYYAHAAALVHPALRDQWGLVVNEAMAAGLPVLVSNRAGCAQDLVKQGENGFTFDPSDTDQLAQLMHRFSTEQVDLKAMGKRSQEIISDWTPERFAERLFAAIEKGLERTDRPFRPTARLILWLLRRLSSRVDSFHAIKD